MSFHQWTPGSNHLIDTLNQQMAAIAAYDSLLAQCAHYHKPIKQTGAISSCRKRSRNQKKIAHKGSITRIPWKYISSTRMRLNVPMSFVQVTQSRNGTYAILTLRRKKLTDPKSQLTMRNKADPTVDIRLLRTLTPSKKNFGRKCLVLDLDETLIHTFKEDPRQEVDYVIPSSQIKGFNFYVIKRPGVDEFLIEMGKHYEIVIYTASTKSYADPILDLLDPNGNISHRLYRESCLLYKGNYVKDLSLLNRDLSQTILVDNSPTSYMFQPKNAIACSSFIDDRRDRELEKIGWLLKGIRNYEEVRDVCNLWKEWQI